MNDATPTFMKCPSCGAVNRVAIDRICWVCEQNLQCSRPIRMKFYDEQTFNDDPEIGDSSSSGGRFTMLGIVVLAIFGLTMVSPGLGILAMFLSMIPLGRMMILMRNDDDTIRGFELFFGSFAASIVICTIVGVTAFGAFCFSLIGFAVLNEGAGIRRDWGELFVLGMTGLSVIIVCIPLGRGVIRRWKRDLKQRNEVPWKSKK